MIGGLRNYLYITKKKALVLLSWATPATPQNLSTSTHPHAFPPRCCQSKPPGQPARLARKAVARRFTHRGADQSGRSRCRRPPQADGGRGDRRHPDVGSGRKRSDAAAPPFSYCHLSGWRGWGQALKAKFGVVTVGGSRGGRPCEVVVVVSAVVGQAARDDRWLVVASGSLMLSFIPVGVGGGRPSRRWWKGPSDAWVALGWGVGANLRRCWRWHQRRGWWQR
jgi:hypothetical protein